MSDYTNTNTTNPYTVASDSTDISLNSNTKDTSDYSNLPTGTPMDTLPYAAGTNSTRSTSPSEKSDGGQSTDAENHSHHANEAEVPLNRWEKLVKEENERKTAQQEAYNQSLPGISRFNIGLYAGSLPTGHPEEHRAYEEPKAPAHEEPKARTHLGTALQRTKTYANLGQAI